MTNTTANISFISFKTLVELKGVQTGEIFVSQENAIHNQNMARILARALANEQYSNIISVALGNGGTYVDSAGILTYNPTKTTGTSATLYNETYAEYVDGSIANGNSITSAATGGLDVTSFATISLILTADEPSGQWNTDALGAGVNSNLQDPTVVDSYQFLFDELGCKTKNPLFQSAILTPSEPEWLLLTHIVFNPIAKSANREIQLTYTITISVS
jgi:hypothetical protein